MHRLLPNWLNWSLGKFNWSAAPSPHHPHSHGQSDLRVGFSTFGADTSEYRSLQQGTVPCSAGCSQHPWHLPTRCQEQLSSYDKCPSIVAQSPLGVRIAAPGKSAGVKSGQLKRAHSPCESPGGRAPWGKATADTRLSQGTARLWLGYISQVTAALL